MKGDVNTAIKNIAHSEIDRMITEIIGSKRDNFETLYSLLTDALIHRIDYPHGTSPKEVKTNWIKDVRVLFETMSDPTFTAKELQRYFQSSNN